MKRIIPYILLLTMSLFTTCGKLWLDDGVSYLCPEHMDLADAHYLELAPCAECHENMTRFMYCYDCAKELGRCQYCGIER